MCFWSSNSDALSEHSRGVFLTGLIHLTIRSTKYEITGDLY